MADNDATSGGEVITLHPPDKRGGRARPKDPTGPSRSRRYRQSRKKAGDRDGGRTAKSRDRDEFTVPGGKITQVEKQSEINTTDTVRDAPPLVLDSGVQAPAKRHGAAIDVAAYIASLALASAAAWFSIRGMVVLFPGSPNSVIAMAVSMEAAKLITTGWLARRWSTTAWFWRLVLVVLVAGLAAINAAGVYAQLVAAHVSESVGRHRRPSRRRTRL